MRLITSLAAILLTAIFILPAHAVTDKEMEEARTITAKAYLRYANDGSGYLDEISVKSMAELNAKLKAKEKENIKAFNSVKVPSDYASWDKEKLVEFWSVTFFTSPALAEKGKAAKPRVRKQISAMNISAPAKEEPAKQEPAKQEPAKEESSAEPTTEAVTPDVSEAIVDSMPTAADAVKTEEEILSDQNAIEKDAAEMESARPEEQSHTWVYVLVLAILVAVVIWLVVYAANLMKRQGAAQGDDDGGDSASLKEQARKAIAKKNEEIEAIRGRLQAEENKTAELGLELEKMKLEKSRLEKRLVELREENNLLAGRVATSESVIPRTIAERHQAPAYSESARNEQIPEKHVEKETPRVERRKTAPAAEKEILKVIYLGRANARGIFVRADRRINPGNTIFRLDTNDGLVGTFHVVDEPEVVETALTNPSEYLSYGCTGEDLEDTAGVTGIATESSGTAIFENGYWRVLRKTRIRYE